MSDDEIKYGLRLRHSDGKGVGGIQLMSPSWTLYYLNKSGPLPFTVIANFTEEQLASPERFAGRLRQTADNIGYAVKRKAQKQQPNKAETMSNKTKEEKALEVCRLLAVEYQDRDDAKAHAAWVNAMALAREVVESELSFLALKAMKNIFAMPVADRDDQGAVARVIERHTRCGELRHWLEKAWAGPLGKEAHEIVEKLLEETKP